MDIGASTITLAAIAVLDLVALSNAVHKYRSWRKCYDEYATAKNDDWILKTGKGDIEAINDISRGRLRIEHFAKMDPGGNNLDTLTRPSSTGSRDNSGDTRAPWLMTEFQESFEAGTLLCTKMLLVGVMSTGCLLNPACEMALFSLSEVRPLAKKPTLFNIDLPSIVGLASIGAMLYLHFHRRSCEVTSLYCWSIMMLGIGPIVWSKFHGSPTDYFLLGAPFSLSVAMSLANLQSTCQGLMARKRNRSIALDNSHAIGPQASPVCYIKIDADVSPITTEKGPVQDFDEIQPSQTSSTQTFNLKEDVCEMVIPLSDDIYEQSTEPCMDPDHHAKTALMKRCLDSQENT